MQQSLITSNSLLTDWTQLIGFSCTVEWGECPKHWCELGQNFSESSPLLLLVKGHWCAMGQKFSAL